MEKKDKPKPRITIEPSGFVVCPYTFVVTFRGQGWRNRQFLTWREALYCVGLIPFEDIFQ